MNIAAYKNGNVNVVIKKDGTKFRFWKGEERVIYPECVDVKITDYCDAGCPFCHERSTKKGKHGNVLRAAQNLSFLPKGAEVAIGGGNPLSHPDIERFLRELRKIGLIPNLTVNQLHLKAHFEQIKRLLELELIFGIGVSYIKNSNLEYVKRLSEITNNLVFHFINKVHTEKDIVDLEVLLGKPPKVLILGYKDFGRGETFDKKKPNLNLDGFNYEVLLFDNLAISQLSVKSKYSEDVWEKRYMGDEFHTSMYYDAVEDKYAPTSTSKERFVADSLRDFWINK